MISRLADEARPSGAGRDPLDRLRRPVDQRERRGRCSSTRRTTSALIASASIGTPSSTCRNPDHSGELMPIMWPGASSLQRPLLAHDLLLDLGPDMLGVHQHPVEVEDEGAALTSGPGSS